MPRIPLLSTVAALALAAVLPAAAQAAPLTYADPGTGAAVTLNNDTYAKSGRIEISGTGFVRSQGTGQPIIALKPDEEDDQAQVARWKTGGPDAGAPVDVGGGEWVLTFAAKVDGTFSGWIDLPDDLALTGPGAGAHAGEHVLRLLSGLLSTDGASPTPPINLGAYFSSVDFSYGMVSASSTFYDGRVFPAAASIGVRGGAFAASAPVAIQLDGAPYSATTIATGATGAIAPTARLTIPAGMAAGVHAFTLTTGAATLIQHFTVAPAAAGALAQTAVTAGQRVAFTATGFRGIAGAGQKVGVMLGTQGVKACLTADAGGALSGTVDLPADATTAKASPIRLLGGASCVSGGEQNDLPARVVQLPFTVVAPDPTPDAPPAATPNPPAATPPPAVVPPVSPAKVVVPRPTALTLLRGGRSLRVALGAGTAQRVTVSVRTTGKVRTRRGGKAKVITLATARTVAPKAGAKATVTLTVTVAGRQALRLAGRLKVTVRVAPVGGGAAVTRTVTLRSAA
ncbi:hypothetical protein DSM104299_03983 [Baekduia alba]|uniref:hypothetical protein n=1 Tax=Baekduia alba TaxID=2997333 RepID=UPI00233F9E7E|nr:hypothetical protein [Baekduia alba]WCB95240.1 hypothetical protein DSM104299_03983 [Baekduia alba]